MDLLKHIEKESIFINACNKFIDKFKFLNYDHNNLERHILNLYKSELLYLIHYSDIHEKDKYNCLLNNISQNTFKDILIYTQNLNLSNYFIRGIIIEYIEYRFKDL